MISSNPQGLIRGGSFFRQSSIRQVQLAVRLLIVIAISLTSVGCNLQPRTTALPEPTRLLALLEGQLTVVNDCSRVNSATNDISYLLVWPPDSVITIDGKTLQITTYNGKQIALQIGEVVRVSGGEVKVVEALSEVTRQKIPPGCLGPYWVVGDVISP